MDFRYKLLLIIFCESKTLIHNLITDELYAELKATNEGRHFSGFTYNKDDIYFLLIIYAMDVEMIMFIFGIYLIRILLLLYMIIKAYLHHIIQ